ncbi:MAG: hypothetical protein KAR87_03990 [Candidatus Aenigmarchaeota archaeon]|nr:hypothetical protein [Candidatus Aenigmarchaeota archaeon]
MNTLRIWDTTLRDGEQSPGFALNTDQKVRVARLLEEIGVSSIEAGFPANKEHDYDSVKAVAKIIEKAEVVAFARAKKEDIELAAKSLECAKSPVIAILAPASDTKLEIIDWTRQQGLDYAVNAVQLARRYVDQVCIGVEFASKADKGYLSTLLQSVVNAGATRIVICDTTGFMLPDQFGSLVDNVIKTVQGDYILGVHCHNDCGMGVANAVEAIRKGAKEVHVTAYGIGERTGNTALETLLQNIYYHKDILGCTANVNYKAIVKNIREIVDIFGIPVLPNSPVIGENAFATGAGMHIKGQNIYHEIDPNDVYGVQSCVFSGPHSGSTKGKERKLNPMDITK